MEARSFKLRKLDEASGSKLPKKQFTLKRKTLTQNSRKHVEQAFSSLPPLTPLHRLKRFKAIRDKNLLKKGPKKMEQKSAEKLTFTEESVSIDSVKSNNREKLEEMNGQQEEENISEKQLTNGGSNVSNGHEVNSQKISPGEINGKQDTKDEDISSSISKESNSSSETPNEPENNSLSAKQDDKQHNNNSALDEEDFKSQSADDNLPDDDSNAADKTLSKELSKKEEENDGSTCSSSTFSSSKRLLSSYEDISELNQSPNENTEEEESEEEEENDRLSSTDYKSDKEKNNVVLRQSLLPPEEVKIHQIPSKIPRSMSNASSYKSTYGSFKSITGRRAVRTYYRSDSRKRKADELETSREGNSADSPSQLSPRWRYFPSSISKLWSPRATPFVFSASSTPMKSFNDSMAVNVDDNTINYHLNDSDLFSDAREMPSSNKRARWGCSIM